MLNKIKKKIKLPQNSKVRLLLFLSIFIVVIAVIYVIWRRHSSDVDFGGSSLSSTQADQIDSTPGAKNLSKQYLQTLLQENKIKSSNALKQGQSYLPTMINSGESYVNTTGFKAKSEDCPCCNKQEASGSLLDQLVKEGKISPDTAADLQRLANSGASVQDYANELQKLVSEGKLTPAQAQALLEAYKADHAKKAANQTGPTNPDDVVDSLLASGKISPETAQEIKALDAKNLTPEEYKAALDRLVAEGKITPAEEQALLAAYRAKHAASAYSANANNSANGAGNSTGNAGGALNSAAAQESGLSQMAAAQALAEQQAQQQAAEQMAAAQRQQERMQEQQEMQATQSSMSAQANRLFASWNAPTPANSVVISASDTKGGVGVSAATAGENNGNSSGAAASAPMIKAGTIMFAVLETAINSDQPGPIMADIVSGKYKGAKLIGSITNQGERVMLQFDLMSMQSWTGTVKIQAVAINPDTARTALASSVNNHYVSRYGSLFAAAFLASYAQALNDNGTTTITPLGTVQRTVSYSPQGRVMMGLGGVAQSLSSAIQQNFNRPPTVKVDSGVGLGILFQNDVAQPDFPTDTKDDSNNTGEL